MGSEQFKPHLIHPRGLSSVWVALASGECQSRLFELGCLGTNSPQPLQVHASPCKNLITIDYMCYNKQLNELGRFEAWIEWTRAYAKPGAQTTSITKEICSAVDCRSPVSKPTHQRIIHIYINVCGGKKFRMHFLNTKKNITNLAHEKFYQWFLQSAPPLPLTCLPSWRGRVLYIVFVLSGEAFWDFIHLFFTKIVHLFFTKRSLAGSKKIDARLQMCINTSVL